jgi:RNA polymerase sigma-70 factor (ECF subfamily)
VTGDWDLAEDCVQEAFIAAMGRWPADGIPRQPGAWLTTVARNRAVDRLRRSAIGAAKERELAAVAELEVAMEPGAHDIGDDRLRLIYTCCHPALAMPARVALTLRTLVGLTVAEIARAFLVPESTMAKRLVRAKQKIHNAGIPYRVPPTHLLPERTNGVLAVLYLLFNQGYSGASEQSRDEQLCVEAIRLAGLVAELMPVEPEAAGLLALMLIQHSRRNTRYDSAGDLITLAEQDRSRWDQSEIARAQTVLDIALRRGQVGPYQLQAAIAAEHAIARRSDQTNWPEIARLYALLAHSAPSPVVELNRAVAIAMADGPDAGLALLRPLERSGELAGYYLLPASIGDLQRRLGQRAQAAENYRAAIDLAPSDAERRFLTRRLEEVTGVE